jgi:catechol 2,3-dioxygenase-like lactoylglutathione lyase family enzyme
MNPTDPTAAPGFPEAGVEMTHILVVSDLERARTWWVSVVGASLYREYGGTSAVLQLGGSWLLLVTGGGPTPDKPDVTFAPPADPSTVSHAMTIRVSDCLAVYRELLARGASFLMPPVVNGLETRCFTRDPDGHLLELSQYG